MAALSNWKPTHKSKYYALRTCPNLFNLYSKYLFLNTSSIRGLGSTYRDVDMGTSHVPGKQRIIKLFDYY
jgi:hypothetical protein